MSIVSVADFIDVLRRHSLVEPAQLNDALALQSSCPDPKALAKVLMQRGWLSPYQVNQILQGRGESLVVEQFLILERLGDGVMGQVFKARHQAMKRSVALKVIHSELLSDETAVHWFYREVEAAAKVTHPNVVHAYDAGPTGKTHFIAMEYVEGRDLAHVVKQSGPLPVPASCDYIRQAALGLQSIADCGLVHRDIKPANLLLSNKPAEGAAYGTVKILDLGLARLQRPADGDATHLLNTEGSVIGTPDFLSPEQAEDPHCVDIRTDLYSLGCTFYYLLAGLAPFPGGTLVQKLQKHRTALAATIDELRPEVPPGVSAVVQKLMAKKPEDRFQTPAELADHLASGKGLSAVRRAPRPATTPAAGTSLPTGVLPLSQPQGSPPSGKWGAFVALVVKVFLFIKTWLVKTWLLVKPGLAKTWSVITTWLANQWNDRRPSWLPEMQSRRAGLILGSVLIAILLLAGYFLFKKPGKPPSKTAIPASQPWLEAHGDRAASGGLYPPFGATPNLG